MTHPRDGGGATTRRLGVSRGLGLAGSLALVALIVFWPAVDGPFFSDDAQYLSTNPWVTGEAPLRPLEILDPRGEPVIFLSNYAPVNLLLHVAAWRTFGDDVRGHHLLNILLHAVAAALLAPLLVRRGVSPLVSAGCAAWFLVHPANVEVAAWASQLKTTSSMVFALAALLLIERRALPSALLFGLALLCKPTAGFALAAAAAWAFVRYRRGESDLRKELPALLCWTTVFALFAVAEFVAFQQATSYVKPIHADLLVRLSSSVAIFGHYLAMGTVSFGVSAFHSPPPVLSPWDPWFVIGAAGLVVIAGRAVLTLVRSREEAGFWIWALAAFVPVAQIFPFPFPMADRYLYPMLPGLMGGAVLALVPLRRLLPPTQLPLARVIGLVALVGVTAAFGVRSHARARLFARPILLEAEAARNYPDGIHGYLNRARRAVQQGQHDLAVVALRGAAESGFQDVDLLMTDAGFVPLHGDSGFQRVVNDIARRWIARLESSEQPTQSELHTLAVLNRLVGADARALDAARRGLEMGGPFDSNLREYVRILER